MVITPFPFSSAYSDNWETACQTIFCCQILDGQTPVQMCFNRLSAFLKRRCNLIWPCVNEAWPRRVGLAKPAHLCPYRWLSLIHNNRFPAKKRFSCNKSTPLGVSVIVGGRFVRCGGRAKRIAIFLDDSWDGAHPKLSKEQDRLC